MSGFFASLPFRPLADSLPGSFAPWLFRLLAFRPMADSPSGSLAPWLVRLLACSTPGWFAPSSWTIRPHYVIRVIFLFKDAVIAVKISNWGEYRIEIKSKICRFLLKLGYIRNLQTCLSKFFSYFYTPWCRCHGAWDDWILFFCCDHLLCLKFYHVNVN